MKLIYIGYAVPKELEQKSKAVSVATNNMVNALLGSFHKIYGEDFQSITITPISSYPKENTLIYRSREFILGAGVKTNAIGFINIPIVKQISIMFVLLLVLFSKIINIKKQNKKEQIFIITSNSKSVISLPLFFISSFFKITKICLVIDIPKTFQKQQRVLLEVARHIDNYIRLKTFRRYEAMVTLVRQTVLDFAPGVPYIVIDYSIKQEEKNIFNLEPGSHRINNKNINISFTGALEEYYGIKNILDAMKLLPSQYNLNLFGKGELEDIIKINEKKDDRIKFHGLVSNENARKAQNDATILLLLLNDEQLSRYALPSKIVEYLASGTPIVATHISSIPKVLRPFINYVDDIKPETIAKLIMDLTQKEELYNFALDKAKKGEQYVLENCNWENQARKISDFIKVIEETK